MDALSESDRINVVQFLKTIEDRLERNYEQKKVLNDRITEIEKSRTTQEGINKAILDKIILVEAAIKKREDDEKQIIAERKAFWNGIVSKLITTAVSAIAGFIGMALIYYWKHH